jgi:uncharacterized repeat protein (TIGR01451 family)
MLVFSKKITFAVACALGASAGVLISNNAAAQQVCATPGRDSTGNLGGVVNSYWAPAAGTYGSTSTTIGLGAKQGAAPDLAPGDLVLVIQMQCATIDFDDDDGYGDGSTGEPASGFSEPGTCQAGRYEYVRAGAGTNASTLALDAGARLTQTFIDQDATPTQGRRSFQIIRVPQYQDASMSADVTAPVWDGESGGVVALDVAGTLNLSNSINVDGLGFRGGGGRSRSVNDAQQRFRWDDDTRHASKGEGIAGTPRFVSLKIDPSSGAVAGITDNGASWGGYPTGTASTGDFARGAPGNAGGGGAFWDGASDNGGGGGGGNGNAGGRGSAGWRNAGYIGIAADYSDIPEKKWGFGGALVPSSVSRVVLGGGGGAGDNNANSQAAESSGANGGGIVMIRAGRLTGSGLINARGARAADNPLNDGAGGGGAGGSVVAIAGIWSPASLQINLNGGRGGDAFPTGAIAHGAGGGGAGGVAIRSGPASVANTGGATGVTTITDNPPGGPSHGAEVGGNGIDQLVSASSDTPGQTAGYLCQADLTISKSNGVASPASLVSGQSTSYSIVVTNNGQGRADGAVLTDPAVAGLTVTAISCAVTTATATCPDLSNQAASISALQSAGGLVIPVLRSGAVLTFTVTATVTATGL